MAKTTSEKRAHFELIQDGVRVAAVDGPRESAIVDAYHYMAVYAQVGGPVTLYEGRGKDRTAIAGDGLGKEDALPA